MVSEVEGEHKFVSQIRKSGIQMNQTQIEQVIKEKKIEILKEIPVPVERRIDVVYDVVVDVPIERIIEREKITEI